jgi:pimeloyl-ACP methyl ester carboxylesterase
VRATTGPVAAFLAILAGLTGAVPAAVARPAGPAWAPCPDDRTAWCATLRVPVDWAHPYGPAVALAVARRPATDPARRIGTLVVNPGGPGGSGVDFALGARDFFSAALRARFDIVGFDPRGVGRSAPVVCAQALVDAAPSPLLRSRRAYAAAVAYNRRLAADCRRRSGPLFDHVDTGSVARDVEALRAALGEETVSFYGASYGTLIGQEYARRYPRRVRAMVLDSVMDHSGGTDAFLDAETGAAQDAFDAFAAWCAAEPGCALHGRDVRALWARLLARAGAGRLEDPFEPGYAMSVFDLVQTAFASFYTPEWDSLAIFLREAAAGGRAAPRGAAVPTAPDSFPAVMCADWALPVGPWPDLAARLRRLAVRAPQMLASPLALTAAVGCLGWPHPPADPQRPLGPARTGPVLLVNARHDPATAYAWAQHVARGLGPAATLVTYEGWGHVVYDRSPCTTGVVDGYLLTVRPPAAGTTCPGVLPPSSGVG